jgi:hypothetical protein
LRACLTFLLGFSLSADALAACDAPITNAQVQASVKSAETAFARVDIDRFLAATDTLQVQVPCVAEPLTPELSAAVHRMYGLRMWVARQPDRAQLAFAAARRIDGAYKFPTTMVPASHPVLKDWSARAATTPTEAVPSPVQGWVRFDGARSLDRPVELPTIAQLSEPDGDIVETAYLWPGVSMLVYDSVATKPAPSVSSTPAPSTTAPTTASLAPPKPTATVVKPKRSGRTAAVGLGVAAGGALLASGGVYAMAMQTEAVWADPATPMSDLASLRETTNRRVATAGGLAVVAAGAGVGALVAGSF